MANMNFGVNILPKANNTYTLGNSDYKWNIFANTLNGISLTNIITDIQIDGTSIVSNNIATIPAATSSTLGLVKLVNGGGLALESGGSLKTAPASDSQIKAGTESNRPIVPSNEHMAAFYGLAKAAGDSTQGASSNAVGTYTDNAKAAIQSMLDFTYDNVLSDSSTNALQNKVIKEELNKKISITSDTVTGNPCTFNSDVEDIPLKSIKLEYEFSQSGSGDPSPTNIRPITGISDFFIAHAKKNMATLRGYSAANIGYDMAGTLTNSYGTTISTTDPESSITITQSSTPNSDNKSHYENGYFSIRTDNMVSGQYYDVSIKVTDITSNPLEANLSNFTITSPNGNLVTTSEVVGNVITWHNLLYKDTNGRQAWEVRICGMSCTISEFMVTPANTNDGIYEPYEGTVKQYTFPAFGKNLFNKATGIQLQTNNIRVARNNGYGVPFNMKAGVTYYIYSNSTTNPNEMSILVPYTATSLKTSYTTQYMTYTPTEDTEVAINMYWIDGRPEDATDIMIETDEKTSYEPFNNTLYGGTVDITNGTIQIEWEYQSGKWGDIKEGSAHGTTGFYQGTLTFQHDVKSATSTYLDTDKLFCNICGRIQWEGTSYTPEHMYIPTSNTKIVRIIGNYDDDQVVEVLAQLATPIIIQFDPEQIKTFKGINTIWANTNGPIEIENHIDLETIKEYADNAGIQDVQINGTSILNNNIATIPLATSSSFGIIKVGYGLEFASNQKVVVSAASSSKIKTGADYNFPIVPVRQHESVFYGLAKAAGDSTQTASDNAVGTYTADAKNAIQSMLSVAPTANPVFSGSISMGRKSNTTIGSSSIAIGNNVEASGLYSHAEGGSTKVSGNFSHAEGLSTTVSTTYAHAEGYATTAGGVGSHAEGDHAETIGGYTHAEGYYTVARGKYSHVSGKYNVPDEYPTTAYDSIWESNHAYVIDDVVLYQSSTGDRIYKCNYAHTSGTELDTRFWDSISDNINYVEIVGNGTATNARSNARALGWDGNEYLKGDLYVGCNADSTGGTKVATISQLPSIMAGATSSAAGTSGLVPAPATTDVNKFLAGDGTYKSGGLPMVILSYGSSTWNDFINAYNNNVIVYCRASSNSNPGTGSQTRMAFMAYVNDASSPTNVEFQYYRSMSSHSATAMGDEVYVYKLTNASGGTWSVTTRKASIKEIAVASGSKLGVSWSSDKVTLSNTMTADDMPMSSSDATTAKSAIDTINTKLGSTTMGTTATTVTGAIAEHENDISTLNSKTNWNFGGNVSGSTLLTLPVSNWTELWIRPSLFSNPKIMMELYIANNTNDERHYSCTGYLSQFEITAAGYSMTPHLLWIDFYVYNQNIYILDANSEEGIANYNVSVWYR